MPTRAEILDTLAASQTQVMTFFKAEPETWSARQRRVMFPEELRGAPGIIWLTLVKSEAQHPGIAAPCTRCETRDVLLRLQYRRECRCRASWAI